jgi:hypothetical protein
MMKSSLNLKNISLIHVGNMYVVIRDQVFQESLGIPMDTECAPVDRFILIFIKDRLCYEALSG